MFERWIRRRACTGWTSSRLPHLAVRGDDQAAHVVRRHPLHGVVHRIILVHLVVDVEVARLLPGVLRRTNLWHEGESARPRNPPDGGQTECSRMRRRATEDRYSRIFVSSHGGEYLHQTPLPKATGILRLRRKTHLFSRTAFGLEPSCLILCVGCDLHHLRYFDLVRQSGCQSLALLRDMTTKLCDMTGAPIKGARPVRRTSSMRKKCTQPEGEALEQSSPNSHLRRGRLGETTSPLRPFAWASSCFLRTFQRASTTSHMHDDSFQTPGAFTECVTIF